MVWGLEDGRNKLFSVEVVSGGEINFTKVGLCWGKSIEILKASCDTDLLLD
jgi:hypothetical protein